MRNLRKVCVSNYWCSSCKSRQCKVIFMVSKSVGWKRRCWNDETHISFRRNGHRQILAGERYRAISCFSRKTKQIVIKIVRQHTKSICERFVLDGSSVRTKIMIDSWRGYADLSLLKCNHSVVNHCLHFVNLNDA